MNVSASPSDAYSWRAYCPAIESIVKMEITSMLRKKFFVPVYIGNPIFVCHIRPYLGGNRASRPIDRTQAPKRCASTMAGRPHGNPHCCMFFLFCSFFLKKINCAQFFEVDGELMNCAEMSVGRWDLGGSLLCMVLDFNLIL